MDNASCHLTKEVKEVFENYGVLVHDHPAVSPDLNPCENIFAFLKNEIWKRK